MGSVEQYKEDIANKYLENLKKELNFFDKIMITPIFTKMKNILKSDKKINVDNLGDLEDLGFWRKVLGVKIFDKQLFKNLVDKIFNFLKEKQEKIIQAETEGRLDELLSLIVNGKLDDLEQNITNSNNEGGESNNNGGGGNNNGGGESNNNGGGGNNNGGGGNNNEGGENDNNEGGENDNNGGGENDNNGGGENDNNGGGESSEGIDPVKAGVAGGVISAATYRELISLAERKLGIIETPKEFDPKSTKRMLENLSSQMKEKLESGVKMNKAQRKVYEKSIKEFSNAAESLDKETAEAFKSWQKLQDKVSLRLLETTGGRVAVKTLKLIEGLADEELERILKMEGEDIVKFFKSKNINISIDLAKQLKVAKNADEVRGLIQILKNGTKLRNFLRGIKGMGAISFLFAGFDVRCYFESKKEAELASKVNEIKGEILKNKANVQLLIGLGTLGLEALTIAATCAAGCSITGPVGTIIGVGVGVIAGAVSIGYDEVYGNKKEFYAQNRYDFINQKRTKVKQSIVQLFESDRLEKNEGMKESIRNKRGLNSETDTMEDAREALIYQEEIMESGFENLQGYYFSGESEENYKNKLDEERKKQYEEEKKKMEDIIKLRMEYIKPYIKKNESSKEYNEMKTAVMSLKGMEYVEQLLANSKIYSYLKTDHEQAYVPNYKELDIEGYKKAYKDKLSKEYNKEFTLFEKIRSSNPTLIQEICEGTLASKFSIQSIIENKEIDNQDSPYTLEQIKILKKNIDFIEKYNEYLNIAVPNEKKNNTIISNDIADYNYIEQILLDLNSIEKRPTWNEKDTMKYISSDLFNDNLKNIDSQVSNCVFQNVLYSIAKEIHGYTGSNDMLELARFYTGDGDNTGIYFSDGFKINDDHGISVLGLFYLGAKDEKINLNNITKDQAIKMIMKDGDLDSPLEYADDKLTQEFRNRVKAIIEREYAYKDKKKEYEKEIIDFIKSNNSDKGGYFDIPIHLVLNAKRSGIGDINKYLFKVENGQIYALSRGDFENTVLNFDTDVKIQYESMDRTGKILTEQEKNLINYVDEAEKKLNKLRDKSGQFLFLHGHEDDLDIPVELERCISEKSKEWDKVKESIQYMQPYGSHDYLAKKSDEFYKFFNGIYISLLNTITNMDTMIINSNDINDSEHFFSQNFVGVDIVSVKDGNLEIINSVNKSIKKHLPSLFEIYKDKKTGKTVKELLLDDKDWSNQRKGQELAKKIYELCLEQAVLTFDDKGAVSKISTLDFSDKDLEKVKTKLKDEIPGIGFQETYEEYINPSYPISWELKFSKRKVEQAEKDSQKEIDKMVENITKVMDNVDRAGKRKEPKFIPNEKQLTEGKIDGKFKSRGYDEKITINMDNSEKIKSITIDGLGLSFSDIQEGFCTVNLINFIKDNAHKNPYRSDAPGGIGYLEYYHWSVNGDLERDVWVDGLFNKMVDSPVDVDIVDTKTMDKYFKTIHNNENFIKYINKFL